MKRKIYYLTGLLLAVVLASSCVGMEDAIFDDSPAVRMNKTVAECEEILRSASNGWLGNYYPEVNYAIGGYAMHFKFEGKNVTISCETQTNVAPGVEATSEWKMEQSQGPVVSINTYNKVLNYFSEVKSSSDTDGLAGDYEFVVVSISEDKNEITLRGKKRGNVLKLTRCANDFNVAAYYADVSQFADSMIDYPTFEINVNGVSYGFAAIAQRKMTIEWAEGITASTTDVPFGYTQDGIMFAQPLTISAQAGDIVLDGLRWNSASEEYTDSQNLSIALKPKFPDGFQLTYGSILGDWVIEYDATSAGNSASNGQRKTGHVTFTRNVLGVSYWLSGDVFDFPAMEVKYDALKGCMYIVTSYIPDFTFTYPGTNASHIGKDCQLRIYFAGTKSTNIYTSTTSGLIGTWNNDEGGERVMTLSNYVSTYDFFGFYLRVCDMAGASLSTNYTPNVGGYIFSFIKFKRTI
ncbi:MAG: DUF4302 domain-containing protein [Dysgonamonadaceae bacterium]|jgi:hypothetical protein|nr:DUF4302 domain-containing protein [Dysgonamonadaceae bacterium]